MVKKTIRKDKYLGLFIFNLFILICFFNNVEAEELPINYLDVSKNGDNLKLSANGKSMEIGCAKKECAYTGCDESKCLNNIIRVSGDWRGGQKEIKCTENGNSLSCVTKGVRAGLCRDDGNIAFEQDLEIKFTLNPSGCWTEISTYRKKDYPHQKCWNENKVNIYAESKCLRSSCHRYVCTEWHIDDGQLMSMFEIGSATVDPNLIEF